jgi:hypothetical protein
MRFVTFGNGRGVAVVLAALCGSAAWAGCNQLFGIELGTPGPSDGSSGDGTTHGDSGDDGGASDATSEEGGQRPLACTLSTPVVIEDFSTSDAGAKSIDNRILAAPSDDPDYPWLVFQPRGNFGSFTFNARAVRAKDSQVRTNLTLAYSEISGTSGNPMTIASTSNGPIIACGTSINGTPNDVSFVAFPLPSSVQGSRPPPFVLHRATGQFNNTQAVLTGTTGNNVFFVGVVPAAGNTQDLIAGVSSPSAGPNGGTSCVLHTNVSNQTDVSSAAMVPLDPHMLVLMNHGFPTAPGWLFTVANDGTNCGNGPTDVQPSGGGLLGWRMNTKDSTLVDLIGGFVDQNNQAFDLTGGEVKASDIPTVQLQPPSLNKGAPLQVSELPFDTSSQAWIDDEILALGKAQSSTDIIFLWIDANGQIVVKGTGADGTQPLFTPANPVRSIAVVPGQHLGHTFAQFHVFWDEQVGGDAQSPIDRIMGAQMQCVPVAKD